MPSRTEAFAELFGTTPTNKTTHASTSTPAPPSGISNLTTFPAYNPESFPSTNDHFPPLPYQRVNCVESSRLQTMATPAGHSYGNVVLLIRGLLIMFRINVNDPGLITLVNKLQDVFTTVGVSALANRSQSWYSANACFTPGTKSYRSSSDSGRRLAVKRKEFSFRKYCWQRFVSDF